ncbi:MAG TPA: fructose-6-phosphate aldolase [Vicinamibacteria bacterium]|jgi:transaldolase
MKIFLDTASVDEIREAASLGLVDGVTTNPSLLAKEKAPYVDVLSRICALLEGPVSAEVVATEAPGMVREGRDLAKIAPNIVVKCPLTAEGLKAVRELAKDGIRSNVTLCFSAPQALFAAKAGAYIVSPFVGRLDDIGIDGMALIRDVRQIYRNYEFPTQILVASIRNPLHVIQAALVGADIATMPASVYRSLLKHPLTDIGLERFLEDWRKAEGVLKPQKIGTAV